MSFVAVAIAGAPIIGGVIQGNAAKAAGDKQAAAANDANAMQQRMYDQTRSDNEGYRAAGSKALSDLANPDFQRDFGASDFTKDPGYDFRMQEGQKALERSAAAKGGLMSGGTAKALERYSQGFASNEYGNAYNRFNTDRNQRFSRLSSIASMGQGANAANQQAGMNYGNQYGNNVTDSASAQGAADIAAGNAAAGAVNGIAQTGMDLAGLAFGGGMGGGGKRKGVGLYGAS